jgi:hypothetical protein
VALCCTVFGQFSLLTVHSLLLNEMAELLPIQKKIVGAKLAGAETA